MNSSCRGIPYVFKKGKWVPDIQTSNKPAYDRPIGKYGRMAMTHLQETHPIRFMQLQMDGTLQEEMHKINERVMEQMDIILSQLLKKFPVPSTEDTLEKTRHINQLKCQAEELVINDVVYQGAK